MLNKAIHHIRHTRPKWYKEYHEWQHHGVLHWATFIVSSLVILMGFFSVLIQLSQNTQIQQANAAAANTQVRQSVTGGALTVSQSGDERMATVSASTNFQDSAGDLGTVTVADNRGSGAGWSLTATASNFYFYNVTKGATTSAINVAALYSTNPWATSSAGTYTITIAQDGGLGTGKYDRESTVTDDAANTYGITIPADADTVPVQIGSYNLYLDWDNRTYIKGETYMIRVETIPVHRFRITPADDGQSDANVIPGSLNFFDLPTENVGLLSAAANYGMGQFTQVDSATALGIPANSFADDYVSRIVITVQ